MTKTLFTAAALAALLLGAPAAKADDGYCREYTRTIYVGGYAKQGYGTACLQPDGSWQIVAENLSDNRYYEPPVVAAPIPVVQTTYVVREPRYYYRPRPSVLAFNFSNGRNYGRHDRWDRNDRHDNDNHHGRGGRH